MDPLEALAERTRRDRHFLGWWLDRSARADQLDDEALAATLGCPRAQLVRLRLCLAPREPIRDFRSDIERIAHRFGVDPARLAALVRRARVLVQLESGNSVHAETPPLMAARDAHKDDPS